MTSATQLTVPELLSRIYLEEDSLVAEAAVELLARELDGATELVFKRMLTTNNILIRNALALVVRDHKSAGGAEVLTQLLADPRTERARGTLLYALAAFEYPNILKLLVNFVLYGSFEVSHQAYLLIAEATFDFPRIDLRQCIAHIRAEVPKLSRDQAQLAGALLNILETKYQWE